MLAVTITASTEGINGYVIRVEVDISQGLPAFLMVGLAEGAVRESRVRVGSAIRNAGYVLPLRKIVANLAPANVRKEGSGFDLPLATAILGALGHIHQGGFDQWALVAELSLEGDLRPVKGIFPMALACRAERLEGMIVAEENGAEAALVDGLDIRCSRTLRETAEFLNGTGELEAAAPGETSESGEVPDLRDVAGQRSARRAIEIAAAGGHNVLLKGPPGAGKSMLARRLPGILPSLDPEAALEATKIWSVAGRLEPSAPLIRRPPFRAPHHTVTPVGLAGGGNVPRPGEVSLAHHGVLFLDELPEFAYRVLEVLRQPLEEGRILLVRTAQTHVFPARFQLVAAMNPCPCGYRGHPTRSCDCTQLQVQRYTSRLSGPLLDRIDLHVEVPPVEIDELEKGSGEPSTAVALRVSAARCRGRERNAQLTGRRNPPDCNADLGPGDLKSLPRPTASARRLLRATASRYALTARTWHRLLKVAWTIADLEWDSEIGEAHVGEAIHYRVGRRERPLSRSGAS